MTDIAGVVNPVETARRRSRPDRFFAVMSVIIALPVFAGFSRTYFLKGLFGAQTLTPFFHLHGVVFTSWILLFVIRSALVRAGRTDIYRRLEWPEPCSRRSWW